MNPIRKLFEAYRWGMALLSFLFLAAFVVPVVGVHWAYRVVRMRIIGD